MSAFRTCQAVEQESLFRLHPWLQFKTDGHYVITQKGPLAKMLQEQCGDVLMNDKAGSLWAIECKAERANTNDNFFFESWSNKSQFNPGWLWKIQADLLLYHFLNDDTPGRERDECYVMRIDELRRWLFETDQNGRWRIARWPEKQQSKYQQMNDTWGFCVPIGAVLAGVKSARRFRLVDASKATNSAASVSARGNGDLSTAQR